MVKTGAVLLGKLMTSRIEPKNYQINILKKEKISDRQIILMQPLKALKKTVSSSLHVKSFARLVAPLTVM